MWEREGDTRAPSTARIKRFKYKSRNKGITEWKWKEFKSFGIDELD